MITPFERDFYVQRRAPFPENTPFILSDDETGLPIDLTGATITMEIRLYEGATGSALLSISTAGASPNSRIVISSGEDGAFLPIITEADHEALPAGPDPHPTTLRSTARFRYDIKVTPATGVAFIAGSGIYYVQAGVTP